MLVEVLHRLLSRKLFVTARFIELEVKEEINVQLKFYGKDKVSSKNMFPSI